MWTQNSGPKLFGSKILLDPKFFGPTFFFMIQNFFILTLNCFMMQHRQECTFDSGVGPTCHRCFLFSCVSSSKTYLATNKQTDRQSHTFQISQILSNPMNFGSLNNFYCFLVLYIVSHSGVTAAQVTTIPVDKWQVFTFSQQPCKIFNSPLTCRFFLPPWIFLCWLSLIFNSFYWISSYISLCLHAPNTKKIDSLS